MIKATDIERFVISPITYWCQLHADQESMDPISPYLQHIFTVGHEYQSEVIEGTYDGATQEIFYDEEEGLLQTLQLMARGERTITDMPLMSLSMGLEGRPDLLVRLDGVKSQFGSFSYYVVEIKTARHIHKGHILQAAAYNRLLGAAQGYEPPEFHLINRDGITRTVQMADVDQELEDVLNHMNDVIGGQPVVACYGSGQWPWESYVNDLAIKANDVSLLSGVGPARRETLVAGGFIKASDVASAPMGALITLHGIGVATANNLITSARALQEGRPVERGIKAQLPTATTEVFFDFEGTDPRVGADGLEVFNYLIGAVFRKPSQEVVYIPFFAASFEEEEANIRKFFEWGQTLEDPVFYHWHHYERTHLNKMVDHFGISPSASAPVLDKLVDLQPITTKSYAFPAYGEGLKDIAKALGFQWRHSDVDGLTSVALFFDYIKSGPTATESRQKILDYNEDDCLATMYIFDWLRAQGW